MEFLPAVHHDAFHGAQAAIHGHIQSQSQSHAGGSRQGNQNADDHVHFRNVQLREHGGEQVHPGADGKHAQDGPDINVGPFQEEQRHQQNDVCKHIGIAVVDVQEQV